jgi:aspartate kinase
MTQPLVVKFGGDALATPERIAAAARRLAARRRTRPVVAVASARRGITDHLLGLVHQVREATGGTGDAFRASPASDRAVASGELVSAALLAVALGEMDIPAIVLDAREAGLASDGRAGAATLTGVRPARVERLLARGVTPVVTGFQGWHRGRLTTLGRGGSDLTAVALATALRAEACELVKDPGALHTADPRVVPDARPIRRAAHRFVTELALAGARVIHHGAAAWAEQAGIPLRFTSLHADGEPATDVGLAFELEPGHALVLGSGAVEQPSVATVSLVSADPDGAGPRAAADAALVRAGARVLRTQRRPHAMSFVVPAEDGAGLLQALHAVIGEVAETDPAVRSRRAGNG